MSTFGERLKEERKRCFNTQQQMADAMEVSRRSQVWYEKNERVPTSNYLEHAMVHGVDILYLFTGIRKTIPISDKEQYLLLAFRKLDDAQQHSILSICNAFANENER